MSVGTAQWSGAPRIWHRSLASRTKGSNYSSRNNSMAWTVGVPVIPALLGCRTTLTKTESGITAAVAPVATALTAAATPSQQEYVTHVFHCRHLTDMQIVNRALCSGGCVYRDNLLLPQQPLEASRDRVWQQQSLHKHTLLQWHISSLPPWKQPI